MNRGVAIFVAGISLLLGGLFARWLARAWQRLKEQRRFRRGRRGEQQAAALLRQAGYVILSEQPSQPCSLFVDDREREYTVRADYLVTRDGRRYVAEVKTGQQATDPTSSATRRQLLEYAQAYDAGLLLVDMEAREILRIAFPPGPQGPSPRQSVVVPLLCGLLGGLAGWALHAWLS